MTNLSNSQPKNVDKKFFSARFFILRSLLCAFYYFFSRSKYNIYPVWQKTKYRMGSNLYFKGFFLLKILELGELMVEKPKNL